VVWRRSRPCDSHTLESHKPDKSYKPCADYELGESNASCDPDDYYDLDDYYNPDDSYGCDEFYEPDRSDES
jgi:hypothetical protein